MNEQQKNNNHHQTIVLRCVHCNHHPMEPIAKPSKTGNVKSIPFVYSICGRYVTMNIEEVLKENGVKIK